MSNCIIAQSGGPTAVDNATIAGIVRANQLNPIYDHVYGSLYGMEGILKEDFIDCTSFSEDEIRRLRQTPGSALGTCRFRIRRINKADFEYFIDILERYDIETVFFTGGNDSMDTIVVLKEFAEKHHVKNHKFIGCPKTIDNDLMETDHAPGYASAARFIASTALSTWLDLSAYPETRKEVFILETMGRDAGWLAASACMGNHVDILIVPEVPFDKTIFIEEVKRIIYEKSKCYVVVSEGARFADGVYVAAGEAKSDLFGQTVLGGAAKALETMIVDAGAATRCRVQVLSAAQRCHAAELSLVDYNEAFEIGMYVHGASADAGISGRMAAIRRKKGDVYEAEYCTVDADIAANYVRALPVKWLKPRFTGITEEAEKYFRPLIQGAPDLLMEGGLPAYALPYYLRDDVIRVERK